MIAIIKKSSNNICICKNFSSQSMCIYMCISRYRRFKVLKNIAKVKVKQLVCMR